MSVQNFFILDATQRAAAMAFNTASVAIDPRAVDNNTPGVGLNLNPDAVGVLAGAAVALAGKFVAPKRIVDDPEYQAAAPAMIAYLTARPWAALEGETIFAPVGRG